MSLTAIFTGIFAVMEAIPILRDAFHAAMSLYYAKKIETATRERSEAVEEFKKADTLEQVESAFFKIINNRAK